MRTHTYVTVSLIAALKTEDKANSSFSWIYCNNPLNPQSFVTKFYVPTSLFPDLSGSVESKDVGSLERKDVGIFNNSLGEEPVVFATLS